MDCCRRSRPDKTVRIPRITFERAHYSTPPPPPPPPNVVSKLRSRFLLPAIAAAAIAALLLVGFNPGPASAQSTPTSYNLATRTTQVCDALLAKIKADSATSAIYGSSGTYPWTNTARTTLITGHPTPAPSNSGVSAPVNLGCSGTGNSVWVLTTALNNLDFLDWNVRLNLRNKGIDALQAGDFAALSKLSHLDLGFNNLATLPGDIFAQTKISWLHLEYNNISTLPANAFNRLGAPTSADGSNWHWGPRSGGLWLQNNPITSLPDTIFDNWTDMRRLDLRNTKIGIINLRWLERLVLLGRTYVDSGGNGWYGKAYIRFDNMPVAKYHRKVGAAAATGEQEYFGDGAALATAIKGAITTYAAGAAGVTDTSVIGAGTVAQVEDTSGLPSNIDNDRLAVTFVPPSIGLNICGERSEAVEREILSTMGFYPNDDLGRGWISAIGDITDARWAKVTCNADTNLPAEWRTIETGELFTGPYDAATHTGSGATVAKSVTSHHQFHTLQLFDSAITDADGALKPADYENLFNIRFLRINNVKIKDIPADTFKHMPNLVELRIDNALLEVDDFTGSNSFLQHFKSLKMLKISGNLLTEFDASTHLPANVRTTLETLHLQYNPIKETDLDGLDLKELQIQGTRITTLDPAIRDMDNLEIFWWRNSFLTNEGIDPNSDPASFFADFPATLTISEHTEELGNPFHSTDPVIQAAAVQTQLDHAARMKAINDADPGNDLVIDRFLGDPCREHISAYDTLQEWSDSSDLCLTGSQISDWVASIDSFNGLRNIRPVGLDLSDAQAGTLLDNIDGKPIAFINIVGAENAFGSGFDNTKLAAFSSLGSLSQLVIQGTALDLEQAKTILTNLKEKYEADGSATSHSGLYHLNLRNNPNLFAGATAASVATFLDGITITHDNQWRPIWVFLKETGLTFPVLKGIVESIDNIHQLRRLDVSQNPGLWNDADGNPVATTDITSFFESLVGITHLYVGDSGMTADQAEAMLNALKSGGPVEIGTDAGGGKAEVRHAGTRIRALGMQGIDLSGRDLRGDMFYQVLDGKYDTSQGKLEFIDLSGTKITASDLQEAINGIDGGNGEDIDELIKTLRIDESTELWASVDPTVQTELDDITTLLARLKNLRTITIKDSGLTLAHYAAILEGLDQADEENDDVLSNIYLIDVRGNPELFAPLKDADGEVTETPSQHAARLAPVFAKAQHSIMRLSETGLTQDQLGAIIAVNADLREQLREGGAVDMTSTPPPNMAAAQSGRQSLKIVFTHEPRALNGGAPIAATGYEYRYRALPADPDAPWTELWRTLTLDLALGTATSKAFSFNIHGLDPQAAYQVQLRASGGSAITGMTAASSAVLIRGGTILNLPQINSISPEVTEVSVRAGDTIRLSVNIFGLADNEDNGIVEQADSDLIFRWSETSTNTGGSFADPNHERRVIYTAPGLPGTYTVMAEAQPDGVCRKHHTTDFGITDAERADCQATVTVHVSRAPGTAEPPPDPINPGGLPPTSLTDNDGTAYAVFLPVEGGTFTGEGITVSAQPGAVPDLTYVGVAASTAGAVPAPTPGARMTLAGSFFDINGVTQNGAAPLTGYTFDDPISACLPLPTAFRGNVSDVVLVERKSDGSIGVLATKIRQTAGALSVCGGLSNLPATVAVAKLGTVPPPPPAPETGPGDELPDTGATTPFAAPWSLWAILLAATATLLATTTAITRARRNTGRTN